MHCAPTPADVITTTDCILKGLVACTRVGAGRKLLARKRLVREPGETLMQFSRRIQNQEISHWYQTYASSRFMPENESLQEQISQLRSQLQEIRSRKASV